MDCGRPLLRAVVMVLLLLLLQELLRLLPWLLLLRGGLPIRAHLLLGQRSPLAVEHSALSKAVGRNSG